MEKQDKLLQKILISTASGAAAAAFLAGKAGQAALGKAREWADNYRENREEINANFKAQAEDLKAQTLDKFSEVKEKLDQGDFKTDDLVKTVKERATEAFEFSADAVNKVKQFVAEQQATGDIIDGEIVVEDETQAYADAAAEFSDSSEEKVTEEDIIIDIDFEDEPS